MDFTGYEYKEPKVLLSTDNAKTIKGELLGYKTLIMYMSPDKQNTTGKSVCSSSTDGCRTSCLFTAGRGKFTSIMTARLHKTEYFLRDREKFMAQLVTEISKAVKKFGADKICVRFNGTSDIPFENIKIGEHQNIMAIFPDVQFYDYTKIANRFKKELPANYHLTFSMAETLTNKLECFELLKQGHNVAAVFNVKDGSELPATYRGYNVVDGDISDLRFLDAKNVIVGLKSKGDAKKDTTGFVIKDF